MKTLSIKVAIWNIAGQMLSLASQNSIASYVLSVKVEPKSVFDQFCERTYIFKIIDQSFSLLNFLWIQIMPPCQVFSLKLISILQTNIPAGFPH
jgi:hypothetical protein